MSAVTKAHPHMTLDQYLTWEATQSERTELVGGEVFALASADDSHVTVSLNLAIALRAHLQGTPCRTYLSDMKLRVDAASSSFYPDVFVTCSEADRQSRLSNQEPTLIAEVLSHSTAGHDLGAKFVHCRMLPSLQEYLLVDVPARRADVYRSGLTDCGCCTRLRATLPCGWPAATCC